MRVVACLLPDAGKPGLLTSDCGHLTVLANDEARRLVEDGVPLKPKHLESFSSFNRSVAVENLHATELRPLCARLRRFGGEGCVLALGATAGPSLGDGGLLARCLGELLEARSPDEDVVVSALRIDCKRGCGSRGEHSHACGGGGGSSDALVDLLQPVVAQRHKIKLAPAQRGGRVEVLGLTECVLRDARRGAAQLRAACVTSAHACSSLVLRLSVVGKRQAAAAAKSGDGPSRLRLHLVLLPATEQLSAGPAAVAFGALANVVHARRPPLRDAHLTLLLRGVLRRARTPLVGMADDDDAPPLLAIAYVGRGVRHSAHALATLKLAARLTPRVAHTQQQPTEGGGGMSKAAAAAAATSNVKALAALDQEQRRPQLQLQPKPPPQPTLQPPAPAESVAMPPVASPEPTEPMELPQPRPPLPRPAAETAAPSHVYQQAVDQATQAAKRAAAVAAIWDAKCAQADAPAPDAAPSAELPAFDDGGAMAAANLALRTTAAEAAAAATAAAATTTTTAAAAAPRAFRRSVAPAIAERIVRFEVASPTPAPIPALLPPTPRTGDGRTGDGTAASRSPTLTTSVAPGTKATATAEAEEVEQLSSQLAQVMARAQAREAQLQQQLAQQQSAAEAAVGEMGAELERCAEEARAWQEVSERLAQQQRAAALCRALGSTRHRRIRTAFGDWLTAMGLAMALDPSSPPVVGTTPLLGRFH